jgi:S-adenosyl-L-methionine hydrolase (adenosine-forming)
MSPSRSCKPNGVVTLTTDFGYRDVFAGILKGVILGINPAAKCVDLTHDVPSYDVESGSFLLANAYSDFPPGSIHLIVVDPGVGSKRRGIALFVGDYWFVAPDNGVLSDVLITHGEFEAVSLSNELYHRPEVSSTFHGRDIFAPVSGYLSKGVPLKEFGPRSDEITKFPIPLPVISNGKIQGRIRYVDRFGNAISNIGKNLFLETGQGRKYEIYVKDLIVNQFSNFYHQVEPGNLLAIFNSFNLLEFAINEGNAAEKYEISCGTIVSIKFLGSSPCTVTTRDTNY